MINAIKTYTTFSIANRTSKTLVDTLILVQTHTLVHQESLELRNFGTKGSKSPRKCSKRFSKKIPRKNVLPTFPKNFLFEFRAKPETPFLSRPFNR